MLLKKKLKCCNVDLMSVKWVRTAARAEILHTDRAQIPKFAYSGGHRPYFNNNDSERAW